MIGFIVGLAVGLIVLLMYRRRYDARLKQLLTRLEDCQPLPDFGYEAQLASAIAHRQARSETLSEQLNDFRELLKNAPLGYLEVDEENRLLWFNQQAQNFLDIQLGNHSEPRLLLAVVRSYELDQLIEQTRTTQQRCEASWTFNSISTDPSNYLERPAYPLKGYGLPISHGHVGVFLENKQEAVLLATQRDRWISDVAHELKTPLTSIRLVAETIESRVSPELVVWVERLLSEIIRLSKLVDDVLNMSHLAQQPNQLEDGNPVDLADLVQTVWQSVEPLAQLKQLDLDYRGPQSMMVKVDKSLMHRVLFNLLSNAVKFSPPHQLIRVQLSLSTLKEKGDFVLLDVIDTGKGLDEKDLPYVFDRFYRADPARSREVDAASAATQTRTVEMAEFSSSGTGLGLAIVRQIVESHQGWVEAKNDPETKGGWLRVGLPGKRRVDAS
ncbi:MAG: histidine kinase [Leptolyngbya foveolarum]|uniref:histidine kinase n=1 Tax=Leptolyngbya foveolarum TaxID=47253 RepID=A0A2W4UAH7_9CYAN|nr:MAG: histidine kinase [Leptolyngbya foveolarum]